VSVPKATLAPQGAMEPKMAEKQANTRKKAGGKPAFF
jgi:hypothetical protein